MVVVRPVFPRGCRRRSVETKSEVWSRWCFSSTTTEDAARPDSTRITNLRLVLGASVPCAPAPLRACAPGSRCGCRQRAAGHRDRGQMAWSRSTSLRTCMPRPRPDWRRCRRWPVTDRRWRPGPEGTRQNRRVACALAAQRWGGRGWHSPGRVHPSTWATTGARGSHRRNNIFTFRLCRSRLRSGRGVSFRRMAG